MKGQTYATTTAPHPQQKAKKSGGKFPKRTPHPSK